MPVSQADAWRIIKYTAVTESGGRFNAWNPDDTGAGISFGVIQFNQAGGRKLSEPGSPLAALLKRMRGMDRAKFDAIFGPYAASLMDTNFVKTLDFNLPDVKSRMLQAAAEPVFQNAQLEEARLSYWLPAEQAAAQFGIQTERSLAMLFDTSVQWGPARMKQFLAQSMAENGLAGISPTQEAAVMRTFAAKADAGRYTRRAKILADTHLTDANLMTAAKIGGGVGVLALAAAAALWLFS